ncbi:uncharacterized protein LOC114938855 isoform X2 [Nylanderia fulva]|uniref:uncharacterized protein LOC114938855 isoform X2 n=1 Tax=Nylanderia fulva TaxID=613905 RepID=UPI0010FB6927|nr:uncharacterized protein LOC114938855 isoform X2 [Nylanderia fulva]
MYGLYKYQKKYSVYIRNTRRRKKLIVLNDNHKMLEAIAENLNLKIPVLQLHKDIVGDNIDTLCNRNISNESESVVQINNFQTLPTSIETIHTDYFMKQTDTSDKNANTEVQNEMISNVVLDNNLQCTNTSDNLTLKIPVVQLNKDNVNNNVDNDTVPCNGTDKSECINETTKDFETLSKVINTKESTKQNQNKFNEKISTELVQNKSASNVILPECSSNIPIMQLNKGYKNTVSLMMELMNLNVSLKPQRIFKHFLKL